MANGLGKALESALSRKEVEKRQAPAAMPLLNVHRRRVFEYLCLRPFQTSGRIALDLKYSPSSVSWHLRRLAAAGYITHHSDGKVYYPRNFVDPEDSEIFIVLHGPKRRELLNLIINSPGISQVEAAKTIGISRQTAGKIALSYQVLGLLTKVQDGRFARWYPTDKLREKQEAQNAKSRAFVEWFLKKLEDEGQSPEMLRRTATEFQVRIGKGRGRGVLSIPLDPYGALAE